MEHKIGGSNERFGAVGCTIACVSMALAHYKIECLPDKLNELLKENNGFTKKGWLIWNTIPKITNSVVGVEIPCKPGFDLIDAALRKNRPVIAKILINGRIPHWVLIVGKENTEYLIKDPLSTGKTLEKLSKFDSNIYFHTNNY
ncbi:MAG: hypothetical protein GY757_45035 [bacterium]|nr:hypothetical protein [bacterium]